MGTCGYIRILGRVIQNVELGVHGNRIMNIISEALWVELLGRVHRWYAQHGVECPSK